MRVDSAAVEISRPHWWRRGVIALVSAEILLTAAIPFSFGRVSDDAFVNLFLTAIGGAGVCAAALGVAMRASALGRRNDGAHGSIFVHDDLVRVDTLALQLSLTRARIVGSAITQHEDELDLALHLDDGTRITARVADLAQAHALVDELGVQPDKRAIELSVAQHDSFVARALLGVSLVACGAFALAMTVGAVWTLATARWDTMIPAAVMALIAWSLTFASAHAIDRTTIHVGGDGIDVKRLAGGRFFPHRGTRVTQLGDAVQIDHEGRVMRVPTSSPREAAALVERIAVARRVSPEMRRATLARAGRDVTAWREHLLGLLHDARAYRSNVTVEDLVASLAPQEAPEARLAAAIALATEPDHRVRIDEAIAATANPRVRIALERAAEGTLDDATLLAASKDEG